VRLARISGEPLILDECLDAVADPAAGGIGCFIGVVRDHDHDRPVTALEYEAHPTAEATLRDVCERFVTDDVVAIAAEHRVGRLGIGDTAVVVVVSAAHRDAALRTSSRLIDAIKAEVPIWKHQFFADGSDEWVNCA
jgi:molybdopterin synthase catalytic subunit